MKSLLVAVTTLWLGAGLMQSSRAQAQTITGYSPTRVAAGDEVTISGQGFGARTSGQSIQFGRGSSAAGDASILSWSDTRWGATSTSTVRVRLPGSISSGTYWLALSQTTAKGERELARGPETLQVSGGTDPEPVDPGAGTDGPATARITGYNPNPACRGNEIRISGEGFDDVALPETILKYGQGSVAGGTISVYRWLLSTFGSSITATLPPGLEPDRDPYWIALFDATGVRRSNLLETLRVHFCVRDPDIRPAPRGAVAPFRPEVKVTPELSIVSVERTGSRPIRFGERIPVEVRVRNSSRSSTEVTVGWVGDKPFRSPGYHSEPREIAGTTEATFLLELTIVPQLTRGGRFATSIVLLDPRSLSLYTADENGSDNSREVSFEMIEPPAFYDITVTWTRLYIMDDSDPHGSGEWSLELHACSFVNFHEGCRNSATTGWPRGVVGAGGSVTMTVTDHATYTIGPSVSLTRVPLDESVNIITHARDDDGLERDEIMGKHRIHFNPEIWRGWNDVVSVRLDARTLFQNRSGYADAGYAGTVTILARPSP